MLAQQAAADAPAVHGSFTHKSGAQLKLDILLSQAVPPEESGPLSTTTHSRETAYDANPAVSVCRKDSADLQQHFAAAGNANSSSISSPMQYSALLQQGLDGNVAAAAAMHYQQQQSAVASTARGPPVTTSLATLPGLQDNQSVDGHRIISSTGPSAATAVFSYLGSPQAKANLATNTVARLPAALPAVSSLYGRLRSSALGSGTGAAVAAGVAATDINSSSSPQTVVGSVIDGRCQVLSSPHLWPPQLSASVGGNRAPAQTQAAVGDSSADYLSLLMASTGLSAAEASGAGTGIAADGPALDAQQQLHLMQQLQQLHGSQPSMGQSSSLSSHTVGTVAGLPPTSPGLLLQQLPVQQQQLLLAGLGNCGSAVAITQEQLKLLNQGSFTGSLLYTKPAGLQLPGLHQVAPNATPGLALNGGANGLTSALAALKVEHALAGLPGSAHKTDGAHNPLYKTELCRTWQETGSCRYGARCQFAHGQVELRAVVRPPKYKTQPCRTYSLTGKCPYGARCNFIHDGEEDEAAVHRPRAEASAAAAALDSTGRASSNGGPTSMNSAAGIYLGVNSAPGMDPAVAAGLFGGVSNGAIDVARLNSLSSWSGVLPSDESYSSNMTAISLGAGNAGLSAMSGLAGLANSIHVGAADGAAGVNFANGNGVVGLHQLPAGLVAANGGGGSVAALAQFGLMQNIGNAQMGLTGFTSDNYSQMLP